jgi:serine/threonine protein kinase
VAIKSIAVDELEPKGLEMVEIEITTLRRASHPNVIKCYGVFEEKDTIHLILERIDGGELFDKVVELSCYSEANAAKAVRQLTLALAHLHSVNIVHRDIKPENLLLASRADDADIKLADFGLSAVIDDGKPLTAALGTPGYLAPEILLLLDEPELKEGMGYGKEVDFFSTGVIAFILLCGYPPFSADDDDEIFDMTIAGEYEFASPHWDNISDEAKALVTSLMETDPKRRAKDVDVLGSSWLANPSNVPIPSTQAELKKWRARKRWKKGINAIIAARKFHGKPLITNVGQFKNKKRVKVKKPTSLAGAAIAAAKKEAAAAEAAMDAATN